MAPVHHQWCSRLSATIPLVEIPTGTRSGPFPDVRDWFGLSSQAPSSSAVALLAGVDIRYAYTAFSAIGLAHVSYEVESQPRSRECIPLVFTSTLARWTGGPRVDRDPGEQESPSAELVWMPSRGLATSAPIRPPPATAQAVPAGNGSQCSDLVVLGLRGSGEEPKASWNLFNSGPFGRWEPPTFTGESDGFGPLGWNISAAFQRKVSESRPATTFKTVGVRYIALDVPLKQLLPPVTPNQYTASIFDGVDKLIARMYAEVSPNQCPASKFVLVGYSQGSLAIHVALRQLADSDTTMLARIAGVGLVADPGRIAYGSELMWGLLASTRPLGSLGLAAFGPRR